MTAAKLADVSDPRFTDDQRATLARFEAAPTPPESWSLRWGLAERLFEVECDGCGCGGWTDPLTDRGVYLEMADAALAFMASQQAAAVAAYRGGATCGHLSPSINFGGDGEAERLMCELPVGHGGAHQHDNGDGLPPTRWIAAQDGGAEEAVRRVEALCDVADDQPDGYECKFIATRVLRAALAPQAGDGAR